MPPIKPKKEDDPRQKPDPKTVEAIPEKEYPEVEATVFRGENALTDEQAKHLLGWEEETETIKFGSDFFLTDENGKKVRLTKNLKNRSYRPALAEKYVQEHLQRRWRLNGETIIIGQYAETMDGQHRLISLPLAEQRRLKDLETHRHWVKNWPGPVTMETVVVTGIDESDEVANSINVGDPRSLGDVLYRSHWFASFPPAKRRLMARAADYGIRFHWHRTGAGMDAFAPRRTHAEAIDHLSRHERLIKCLKHVVDENGDGENRLGKYLSLGYSAALMYLMGSGRSDYDKYKNGDVRSEKRLDWSLFKRAEEFWALLAGGDDFKEVRFALGALNDPETGKKASMAEVVTVIVKAWRLFAEPGFEGFAEHDERINLGPGSYQVKDDVRVLIDNPTCGGIDLGEPKDEILVPAARGEEDGVEPEETEGLVEEVETEKEAILDEAVSTEGKGVADLVTAARKEWPGRLVAFRHRDHYRVWGKDADVVSKITGAKKDAKLKVDGLQYLRFSEADFPTIMTQVIKAKVSGSTHVVIAKVGTNGKPELLDDDYDPSKPEPKKAKKGGK